MVHKNCLETWLSTAKNSNCEICGYEFDVTKEYKPWTKVMIKTPYYSPVSIARHGIPLFGTEFLNI